MDVIPESIELADITYPTITKADLPYLQVSGQASSAVGEAALYELNRAFDGDADRAQEKMDVVWHDHEGVQAVFAFGAIVKNRFDKWVRKTISFEDGASLPSCCGDEVGVALVGERAETGWAHDGTSAAKAANFPALRRRA